MKTAPEPTLHHHSSSVEGWRLHVLDTVDSTNNHAVSLPVWSAVRASKQTGGRGRTRDRHWVSDDGGLWLSAVLPCPGSRSRWEILPLAAGWAVVRALREFGVTAARLRWPNDVMVGRAKLAGLLVERFRNDTAVVGVGLNIFNHPEQADPALAGLTERLADLVPGTYTVDDVAQVLLRSLRHTHAILLDAGFRVIADDLNLSWAQPRPVELTLNGRAQHFQGVFQGIDQKGRLRIATAGDGLCAYEAAQVALLRELE